MGIAVCEYCLNELKSRGEKFDVIAELFEPAECEFCFEEGEHLFIIKFK